MKRLEYNSRVYNDMELCRLTGQILLNWEAKIENTAEPSSRYNSMNTVHCLLQATALECLDNAAVFSFHRSFYTNNHCTGSPFVMATEQNAVPARTFLC